MLPLVGGRRQTKTKDQILAASKNTLMWGPVVDGVEILEDPIVATAQGRFLSPVPTILGSNKDEGTAFATILPRNVSGLITQAVVGLV
jgi:carboxylesterase type B